MADWLSVNQAVEFDRIHNHGTWATASVGMLGYVLGDTSYVNRERTVRRREHLVDRTHFHRATHTDGNRPRRRSASSSAGSTARRSASFA